MSTISIDRDKCCGAGHCVRVAPEVFDQDDDGIVTLLDPAPTGQAEQNAKEAAELCPTWAITVS